MNRLSKNGLSVLEALDELGGSATTRQIAEKVGRSVNGVSQTLSSLVPRVALSGGKKGETKWRLVVFR